MRRFGGALQALKRRSRRAPLPPIANPTVYSRWPVNAAIPADPITFGTPQHWSPTPSPMEFVVRWIFLRFFLDAQMASFPRGHDAPLVRRVFAERNSWPKSPTELALSLTENLYIVSLAIIYRM
jgi:hypothetical protein